MSNVYHFILKCPFYTNLRHLYIKKYYWFKPSVFKLVQLLSVQNRKELCNIGKYLVVVYCEYGSWCVVCKSFVVFNITRFRTIN